MVQEIFWVLIFASIRSSPSLEIWNTLPGYCTDIAPRHTTLLTCLVPPAWLAEMFLLSRTKPNARISKRLLPILRTASQLIYQNFARANDPAGGYAGYVPCEQFGPIKQIITLSANTMIP